MHRAAQVERLRLGGKHGACLHLLGKARTGKCKGNFGDEMIVAVQRIRRLGTKGGQRIEDLLNFVLFPAFQKLQLVICLDDGDRLDEHGRAGCRCIMHKPLDLVPVLHLDRHDVAVVAHGHDVFLQQLAVAAADKLLQRVLDLVVRRADLAADLGKL